MTMDNGASFYADYLNGDDEGFYRIVREYYDGLTMYVYGIVGDFFRAEEVADDTLLKLSVKKPPFRGASSFRTWLYSIGKKTAIDSLRRSGPVHTGEGLDENTPSDSDPESDYIKDERNRQLYKALGKLDPEYREVLYLSFFEDMSADDIAVVMRKKRNYVYQIVFRAKKALKEELEKEGFVYD